MHKTPTSSTKTAEARKLPLRASMPIAGVRALMRNHHVFVLPSNGTEGWGAVVNEAMQEGCVVIGSEAAGSSKSILRNRENGLLFSPGDWRTLSEHLHLLGSDTILRATLARSGTAINSELWCHPSQLIGLFRYVMLSSQSARLRFTKMGRWRQSGT